VLARAVPLAVECPECGSAGVFYSCDPRCCFNHVCESCRASFFLSTRLLGETSAAFPDLAVGARGADTTGPTAPCARCQGIHLLSITIEESPEDRGQRPAVKDAPKPVMCSDCGAFLAVEISAEDS
jgi:hypothetical protein